MDIICTKCAKALFNEVWGDYKCSVRKHHIPNIPGWAADCEYYAEGEPQLSKHTYEYELSKGDDE